MVNKDMHDEFEKLFAFIHDIIEGKGKAATEINDAGFPPKSDDCCGKCCGHHDNKETETPITEDNGDAGEGAEELPEVSTEKDIYFPIPCEGELVDIRAVYDKKIDKMLLHVKSHGEFNGVKFTINQEITLDCSEVPIDTTTLDVEYDELGAVEFSANLSKENGNSIVEFC